MAWPSSRNFQAVDQVFAQVILMLNDPGSALWETLDIRQQWTPTLISQLDCVKLQEIEKTKQLPWGLSSSSQCSILESLFPFIISFSFFSY